MKKKIQTKGDPRVEKAVHWLIDVEKHDPEVN